MEDVVANLVKYQNEQTQYQPTVITLDRLFRNSADKLPKNEVVEGIPVIRLPYSGSSRYPICLSVFSLMKDFDVIHVHGVDFFYDFLALTKFIHKKKIIASTHGGFFHTPYAAGLKKVFFNTVTGITSALYDKVVACSDNDFAIFSQIAAAPRLVLVENGVNVEKFENVALGHAQSQIVYFGRWSVNKGLPELIELIAQLQKIKPEFSLVIAGRPYDVDAQKLNDLVSQNGLTNIQIIESPSNEQLKSIIASSSYFACLSHHEGFGLAAIEAMSAGLIPILSAIPPFEKIQRESQLGFILKDKAEVKEQINSLAQFISSDKSEVIQQKEKAAEFAKQYSWTNVAKKYMELYE
ncbi:glycosyltransferase family 4 protein [Deefgea tanakiae]|nr:glycosyltransferase family 4 protein [Deefgea tanakiae]